MVCVRERERERGGGLLVKGLAHFALQVLVHLIVDRSFSSEGRPFGKVKLSVVLPWNSVRTFFDTNAYLKLILHTTNRWQLEDRGAFYHRLLFSFSSVTFISSSSVLFGQKECECSFRPDFFFFFQWQGGNGHVHSPCSLITRFDIFANVRTALSP